MRAIVPAATTIVLAAALAANTAHAGERIRQAWVHCQQLEQEAKAYPDAFNVNYQCNYVQQSVGLDDAQWMDKGFPGDVPHRVAAAEAALAAAKLSAQMVKHPGSTLPGVQKPGLGADPRNPRSGMAKAGAYCQALIGQANALATNNDPSTLSFAALVKGSGIDDPTAACQEVVAAVNGSGTDDPWIKSGKVPRWIGRAEAALAQAKVAASHAVGKRAPPANPAKVSLDKHLCWQAHHRLTSLLDVVVKTCPSAADAFAPLASALSDDLKACYAASRAGLDTPTSLFDSMRTGLAKAQDVATSCTPPPPPTTSSGVAAAIEDCLHQGQGLVGRIETFGHDAITPDNKAAFDWFKSVAKDYVNVSAGEGDLLLRCQGAALKLETALAKAAVDAAINHIKAIGQEIAPPFIKFLQCQVKIETVTAEWTAQAALPGVGPLIQTPAGKAALNKLHIQLPDPNAGEAQAVKACEAAIAAGRQLMNDALTKARAVGNAVATAGKDALVLAKACEQGTQACKDKIAEAIRKAVPDGGHRDIPAFGPGFTVDIDGIGVTASWKMGGTVSRTGDHLEAKIYLAKAVGGGVADKNASAQTVVKVKQNFVVAGSVTDLGTWMGLAAGLGVDGFLRELLTPIGAQWAERKFGFGISSAWLAAHGLVSAGGSICVGESGKAGDKKTGNIQAAEQWCGGFKNDGKTLTGTFSIGATASGSVKAIDDALKKSQLGRLIGGGEIKLNHGLTVTVKLVCPGWQLTTDAAVALGEVRRHCGGVPANTTVTYAASEGVGGLGLSFSASAANPNANLALLDGHPLQFIQSLTSHTWGVQASFENYQKAADLLAKLPPPSRVMPASFQQSGHPDALVASLRQFVQSHPSPWKLCGGSWQVVDGFIPVPQGLAACDKVLIDGLLQLRDYLNSHH